MKVDYDVIVIGAGIGGLSAASLFSHAGFRTLVLEKNNFLGGRCASYRKNDCLIDAFIHMFARCEQGPYGEILRRTAMPEAIRFWHADPSNKPLMFLQGKPYVYPDASFATAQELRETFGALQMPDEDYQAALRLNEDIYGMSEEETHRLDGISFYDWISNYSTHEALLALHNDRCMLMAVVGMVEASAGEVIRMTQNWQLRGTMGYPMGGCQAIPDGLAGVVRRYGGQIRTAVQVDEIVVSRGAVRGVKLKGGEEITARAVVSNAGLKETVGRMVPESALPGDYRDYVEGLSCGMFGTDDFMNMFLNIKVLLDEPVIQAPVVFSLTPVNQEKMMEVISQIASGQEPDAESTFSIFMPIPSNMDPSLVPHGRQLLNFPGLAPPGEKDLGKWVARQMDFLGTLYPGLQRHMLWWDVVRGAAVKGFSGRFQSDIVGLAQIVGQVGPDRPSIASPLAGLFHVGSDVGRDNIGTELAAESALRAAEIVRDFLRSP